MNAQLQEPRAKPRGRHLIRKLYDADADFNCFGAEPVGSYMLATIPRSGSTFCAIRFWQTGLLGAPMEYLNFQIMGDLFRRLRYEPGDGGCIPADKIDSYWSDVQRLRTSPNGVFGYKMFTSIYLEISKRFPHFLQRVTPNYVVYLTRRDVVGQAISYSRARMSRVWFGGTPNAPEVDYDYEYIKGSLRSVVDQKSYWESIFALTGTVPIRIFYEDLLNPEVDAVATVLQAMGIRPDPDSAIPVPLTMRQSDGVSKEWRERFMDDNAKDADRDVVV